MDAIKTSAKAFAAAVAMYVLTAATTWFKTKYGVGLPVDPSAIQSWGNIIADQVVNVIASAIAGGVVWAKANHPTGDGATK